jgi:hypothetical protein
MNNNKKRTSDSIFSQNSKGNERFQDLPVSKNKPCIIPGYIRWQKVLKIRNGHGTKIKI